MSTVRDRILLVEHNAEISDLIGRQTLVPLGYQVDVSKSAATALHDISRRLPDIILADLKLPGLSGKDLLVALAAQGLDIPVILLAEKGMEADIIQAFRLGAADYIFYPAREAEILSAVERVLKQVRARREREALDRQLERTNQELQRRVRELTTIYALGKTVTSITSLDNTLSRIVEGAITTTEADAGWLQVREGNEKTFVLGAQRNLPENIAQRIHQSWDDGISSLAVLSGEPLALHGEPLNHLKISRLGQSVLVVPVKIKSEIVGLLTVIRKTARPFSQDTQALLGAVADFASIAIMNARLFKALDERAHTLQQQAEKARISEKEKTETISSIRKELNATIARADQTVTNLLAGKSGPIPAAHTSQLHALRENLQHLSHIIESLHGQ